jgi:hypothetical protein
MFDPIHCEDGKWYFWIKTGVDRAGPFENECDAKLLLASYEYSLNTGEIWDYSEPDKFLKITLLHFYYAGTRRTRKGSELVISVIDNLIGY